jgi:hypothetical protein
MLAEMGGEFFVLLTTYLVVYLFRVLCELLKVCSCGIQESQQNVRPHGWLHNSLFRCTTTYGYLIFESIVFILFVAGLALLVLIGRDVVPEHRAALLLSWRLTTTTTTILTLVCSRDTSDRLKTKLSQDREIFSHTKEVCRTTLVCGCDTFDWLETNLS